MHNIADPLIFYFASVMPCQSLQNGAEGTGFQMHVSSDAFLRDHESAFWSGGSTALENSQSDWNSVELNPLDSLFLCDTTLLHPSLPSNGPHTSDNSEDAPSWDWGASSASESPMIYEDSVPVASTSSSPANNFMYSYDDPTPSPLHLNEFSNVIDFDFSSSSMQNDNILSESLPSSLPSSLSRRRSPRPLRNVPSPDFQKSREVSPTHSDSDHKRRFPCQILGCVRRFTSQYTLKVHMEAHKPKPRISFPCTLGCSERFSRQHDRLRHEVAKHGKVCEFLCDDCGRFFSSSKTLGNHKCPVAQGSTRWVNVGS